MPFIGTQAYTSSTIFSGEEMEGSSGLELGSSSAYSPSSEEGSEKCSEHSEGSEKCSEHSEGSDCESSPIVVFGKLKVR